MITISVRELIYLFFLLVTGCFLRFYHLGFQSFWLDELHTAIEADPSLSWGAMGDYFKCCDQHPPLFFVLEKQCFFLFASTEFVARSVSAVAGTAGIYAIYLLGRELFSVRLGLIASTLVCFNYFHIWYSQEARPYALAFLLACLSFLYLIKLIKNPTLKHSLYYALFALLMIATHYFGLFVLISQASVALIFWIREKEDRKKRFKHFAISFVLIGVCYLPWLPFLRSMTAIKSFWIQPVAQSFAIDFFYDYFGDSDVLKPFVLFFLVAGLSQLFMRNRELSGDINKDPVSFAFLNCILWIVVSYFIPYLRSILRVPMLYPRYTIVIFPAFIILLAFGLELVASSLIRCTILTAFVLLSLTDIFFVKEYYTKVSKSQFREMAAFISSDTSLTFPVYGGTTGWHQQYYARRSGNRAAIIEGDQSSVLDSILARESSLKPKGFWLADAHLGQKPNQELLNKLKPDYILAKSADFKEAWAQLYLHRSFLGEQFLRLNYRSFHTGQHFNLNGDTVAAIWEKEAVSLPFKIEKGKYSVVIELKGDKALDIFPHLDIKIGGKSIGQCSLTQFFESYTFNFETPGSTETEMRITMDNDAVSSDSKEDRNAFIRSIVFIKENK